MKTDFGKRLRDWYNGQIEFSDQLYEHDQTWKQEKKKEIEHPDHTAQQKRIEKKEIQWSLIQYRVVASAFCLIFIVVLILTVANLPGFFSEHTPTDNEVAEHYIVNGRDETGATSAVAGMILDYRAFDTLGESFVLFTATCAVLLLMEELHKDPPTEELDIIDYGKDTITKTVSRLLIPIILLLGVYIVLNGHTSPGGGFAGGAVLGTGFIMYAMIFGEERATRVMSGKLVKIITIAALGFYCLAKSYSFFTGNEFNGVHSIIRPGIPGTLFSGGLILPLNIAVGMVVCCTMYSFYMLFKRGRVG